MTDVATGAGVLQQLPCSCGEPQRLSEF